MFDEGFLTVEVTTALPAIQDDNFEVGKTSILTSWSHRFQALRIAAVSVLQMFKYSASVKILAQKNLRTFETFEGSRIIGEIKHLFQHRPIGEVDLAVTYLQVLQSCSQIDEDVILCAVRDGANFADKSRLGSMVALQV